jgi:RIO kinase 1
VVRCALTCATLRFSPGRVPRASPRLKDTELDRDTYTALYRELVLNVRTLFHQCRLVHADLSEYNILFHADHLYIIDVSQSVEHDHPSAFDFLRNDINNVEEFFSKNGVLTMGLRRCFDFITREKFLESDTDAAVAAADAADIFDRWIQAPVDSAADPENALSLASDAHEDSVFRQSYIPRSLNELYDPERDIHAAQQGHPGGFLIYSDAIGVVDVPPTQSARVHVRFDDNNNDQNAPETADADDRSGGSAPDEESGSDEEVSEQGVENDTKDPADRRPRGHRHEDKEAKKVC